MSVRACGSSAITASVNDCVSRSAPGCRGGGDGRSSVRDAARRLAPRRASARPRAASPSGRRRRTRRLVRLARPPARTPRALVGQPGMGDGGVEPAKRRGGVDDRVDEMRLGDDDVERPGSSRSRTSVSPSGGSSTSARPRRRSLGAAARHPGAPTTRSRPRREAAHAKARRDARAFAHSSTGPATIRSPSRRLDAHDTPGELQVGLHAVEGGFVGHATRIASASR